MSYSYSDVGLRTNMTVTGENTVFYQYENANKLTSVTQAKFTAREDDGTGLYFYRARYYHPVLARFASEDPIEYDAGYRVLYSYAKNDPLNYIDVHGLSATCSPWEFVYEVARPKRTETHEWWEKSLVDVGSVQTGPGPKGYPFGLIKCIWDVVWHTEITETTLYDMTYFRICTDNCTSIGRPEEKIFTTSYVYKTTSDQTKRLAQTLTAVWPEAYDWEMCRRWGLPGY